MRIRTMQEITDGSTHDIARGFMQGTVRDVVVESHDDDEVFADLPDEWPEPTNQDREHVAHHYQPGNQLDSRF